MRVCMLSIADATHPYGSTNRPQHIGNHLSRNEVELIHICEKLPPNSEGPKIISRQDYGRVSDREEYRILLQQCCRFSPDLIYSHQLTCGRMGLSFRRRSKRAHIYDAHSSVRHELSTYTHLTLKQKFWLVLYEALVSKLANRIIVPSKELRDYFEKAYFINPKKIRIIKNGVETDVFKPASSNTFLRKSLGIPEEATLIVFTNPRLANFPSNEMALHMMFRLIPEIERRLKCVRFLILGGGRELPGPSSNIIYTGFVKDLPAYLNLADICIAPYPPQAVCGGTRNKICEYMACGKPIIATTEAIRGFEDAIPGKHFLLADDEKAFVGRIEECIHNPEMARQLGKNARVLSKEYDWGQSAARIKEVFKELI